MIKKLFPILLLPLTLVSCLNEADSQYTPQILSTMFVCNTTDTLRISQDTDGYRLDTISVGDTVRFAAGFNAVLNNLLTARVSWEEEYIDLHITNLNQIRDVMLATSDSAAGVIHLPEGYPAISFPVEYVALKPGTPTITLTAESDSKYSPAEIKFKAPIK